MSQKSIVISEFDLFTVAFSLLFASALKAVPARVREPLIANPTPRALPFYGAARQMRLRKKKIEEKNGSQERREKNSLARARAREQRPSATSLFEREKALSNFQFSQSGPKIRDRAPVMAEVQ